MSNSVLLCISTLLDSGNHYSKMFELKDALGLPLFETITICLVCGMHFPEHVFFSSLSTTIYDRFF